jgi:hypothetical protein
MGLVAKRARGGPFVRTNPSACDRNSRTPFFFAPVERDPARLRITKNAAQCRHPAAAAFVSLFLPTEIDD